MSPWSSSYSLLFSQTVRKSLIVAESLHRLSIFHLDASARIVFHLLDLCLGGICLVILPAGSVLADVLCERIHLLVYKATDIDPGVFVLMIVVVVEKIFGDHIFLQSLLSNLPFEEQAPHGGAGCVSRKVGSGAVVGLMPSLIVLTWIPRHQHRGA